MQYELKIPPDNLRAHYDIETDIEKIKNGLMTFVIRVHDGKITDYNLMETVNAKAKYLSTAVTWTQQVVSCDIRK